MLEASIKKQKKTEKKQKNMKIKLKVTIEKLFIIIYLQTGSIPIESDSKNKSFVLDVPFPLPI